MIEKLINSQGEKIAITECGKGPFEGEHVLILFDDFPSPVEAPHLLDDRTIDFLIDNLTLLKEQKNDSAG